MRGVWAKNGGVWAKNGGVWAKNAFCGQKANFRGQRKMHHVSHGGLKLSHERLQRLESRLNLGRASRLGIWDMTFERSTHIFLRSWAFADPFSQSGLSIAAIIVPLMARITRFAIGDSNESSLGRHALQDRNVRVDRKLRESICWQRARQMSRFFQGRNGFNGIDGTESHSKSRGSKNRTLNARNGRLYFTDCFEKLIANINWYSFSSLPEVDKER